VVANATAFVPRWAAPRRAERCLLLLLLATLSEEAGWPGRVILSHGLRHRVQLLNADFDLNGMFCDLEIRIPNDERPLTETHQHRPDHTNALHMAANYHATSLTLCQLRTPSFTQQSRD
jgi:hypothetical protein